MRSFHPVLLILGSLLALTVRAQPAVEQVTVRTLYESWQLPGGESMGVVALGARQRFGDHVSLGVDFFDAVRGNRGGFITLGLGGALDYPLGDRWAVESELFVGAGSGNGGYELAGGGLMVRGSAGLRYGLTEKDALSIGLSGVAFPAGGTIHSAQLYAGYSRSFKVLMQSGQHVFGQTPWTDMDWTGYAPSRHAAGMLVGSIRVPAAATRIGGGTQQDLRMMGIEWQTFADDSPVFLRFETAGAMGGSSAGYMHILAGAGVELPLYESLVAEAVLNVGGGGGGGVRTGGGLLTAATLGLRVDLMDGWFMKASGGRIRAVQGELAGDDFTLVLGRHFAGAKRGEFREQQPVLLISHPLRLRVAQQTYTGLAPDWRSRPDREVANLGAAIDYFIDPRWFVSGQGMAAYAGEAGAFMTGLVGGGYRLPLAERLFVQGEMLLGAAGGGGINVGSGLVQQFNLSLGYRWTDSLSLMLTAGEARALNGPFRARVWGLALGYDFNLFTPGGAR